MGRFENIQWGLEKGIEAFGQTFTPLYTKGIEMANRITLQNYLMQKRMEAQLEAYKQRRLWEMNQERKEEEAKFTALNLTELHKKFDDIDNAFYNATLLVTKSFKYDINPEELKQDPEAVYNAILKSAEANAKMKERLNDLLTKRNAYKQAIIDEQMQRLTKLYEAETEGAKKDGILGAISTLEQLKNQLKAEENTLNNQRVQIASEYRQKLPELAYKTMVEKQRYELGELSKQINEFKLQIMEAKYEPDTAQTMLKNILTNAEAYGIDRTKYEKMLTEIMADEKASPIAKVIELSSIADLIKLDLRFKEIEMRKAKTLSVSLSDLVSASKIIDDVKNIMNKYPYNKDLKLTGEKILSLLNKKDLTKVDIANLKILKNRFDNLVKNTNEQISKNIKILETYIKSTNKLVSKLEKDDIAGIYKDDFDKLIAAHEKLNLMLAKGTLDRNYLETYQNILNNLKQKLKEDKDTTVVSKEGKAIKSLLDEKKVKILLDRINDLERIIAPIFSALAKGKVKITTTQRQIDYQGTTREEMESIYSELDKQQSDELISEKEEEEEYYLNLEDYLSPEITIYP